MKGDLSGETVLVIGGSAGIGLQTARRARQAGAQLILTARNPEPLAQAARELEALSTHAFDANDPAALRSFFATLSNEIDHVMVTAGAPIYTPPLMASLEEARLGFSSYLVVALNVAQCAARRLRDTGSLTFMGGTGGRRPRLGTGLVATATVALPALVASLALELAPRRVNLIAAGFVDTSLSAKILGDSLELRRTQLRATLPIRRIVTPDDVAALAVHLMTNTALNGATFDIDGGQQLI